MEKDSVTFSVQMTARELYKFNLYHTYHGFSGLFGLTLSLLALVNLFMNFHDLSDTGKTIMIIIGIWFTIWEPLMMKSRAKAQLNRSKAYKKPLNYEISETGITVSQDEQNETVGWDKLVKVVETKSQFLLYSSRIHAFIFPKSMMEGQESEMRGLILAHTENTGVKRKGKIKK